MFQAPADDELPPPATDAPTGTTSGFKAPDTDDDAPKWADLPKNIIPDAEAMLKNNAGLALRTAKGVNDLPGDLANTAVDLVHGKSPMDTPLGQDAKTVGSGLLSAAKAIPKSITDLGNKEAWIQHPVGNAMTAGSIVAPFLGPEAAAEDVAEGAAKGIKPPAPIKGLPGVPREIIEPDVPPPAAAAPVPPAAPKDLPIVEAGAKTGDPHALFAYNDQFGEGGANRSLYNVYGDPTHPAIQGRGWGSSVTEDDLNKAGIPITGRAPSSAKWEPIPSEPKAAPEAPPAVSPPAAPVSATDALLNKAMDKGNDVKNYISRGYEGFAKKPGVTADIADYIQGKSQKAAAQQMGMTPGQARQMGATPIAQNEAMRAIGQYALDNGIVGPTVGHEGMLTRNAQLLNKAGDTLNKLRQEADATRNPLTTSIDPLQQIHANLDAKYSRGSYSGQAGHYAKALEDVEDAKPTLEGLANAATKLNKAANESAKINQPHGPYTDVANEITHINNERIRQILGPEKAAQYDAALKEYGVNKKIGEFLKRKTGGEIKRMGPGSFTSNMIQKGLDEFGYRAGAKVANKVSTSILKDGSIAKSLPSLFKEFVNQIEDVGHEVTGMAKGGIVPNDVKQWVSARGC